MRRRRRHPPTQNHERWLVSYADFITLLFAFFVVMYASSQVDKRRVGQLALAIQSAFEKMGVFAPGSQVPLDLVQSPPIEQLPVKNSLAKPSPEHPLAQSTGSNIEHLPDLRALKKKLESALADQLANHQVALREVPDGLIISLREVGFFDSGSADIKPGSRPAFSRMAEILANEPYRIRIEGYTDNIPVHNTQFTSNWELSTARATEIVRLLITRYAFAPDRLSAAGYAQYHPVASNATSEGRAQNRRVDVVVLGRNSNGIGSPSGK